MLPLVLALALAAPAAGTPAAPGAATLHAWDGRRAAAWAAGDAVALRGLYTPGSVAGRRDAAMLRAWSARDLAVAGIRMQLLDVDLRRRTPRRLVLAVTDRLVGARVEPGAVTLPLDRPSRHVVTMRVVAGEWRVAAVRRPGLRPDRSG